MKRREVIVVGAGPAGLAAATAAAAAGADTLLIDEQVAPGGQLRYRLTPVTPDVGNVPVRPALLRDQLLTAAAAADVEIQTGTVAWGLFEDDRLGVAGADTSTLLAAEIIIVATGSTDRPWPFAGCTLPGVFSARAIQILLHLHRVRPGRRVAVVGGGTEAAEVAADLRLAGGDVVVTIDPEATGASLAASGADGVHAFRVNGERHDVDAVVVAVGRQADAALAWMAGAAFSPAGAPGDFVPRLDERLRTTNHRLLIAGDAAGPTDVPTALAEGRYAGRVAAATLGLIAEPALAAARRAYEAIASDRVAARQLGGVTLVQTFQ